MEKELNQDDVSEILSGGCPKCHQALSGSYSEGTQWSNEAKFESELHCHNCGLDIRLVNWFSYSMSEAYMEDDSDPEWVEGERED